MPSMYRNSFIVSSLLLTVGGLASCSTLFSGENVRIRPIETMSGLSSQRDPIYESAVTAINTRDYGRALDYLQEAKARNPRNVKALNALGVVYDKLGRFDLSARYYAQARAIEPESQILAENFGYSQVLQNLLHPNQQIAVPTIKLPAVALNKASPALPNILSASPAFADSNVVLQEKQSEKALMSPAGRIPALPPLETLDHIGPPPAAVASADSMMIAKRETFSKISTTLDWADTTRQKRPILGAVVSVPVPVESLNGTGLAGSPRKVFVIGHPLRILDASGKKDRAGFVTRRLAKLGWSVRASNASRNQPVTTLTYPRKNEFAARAMQRTLPFPVRLAATDGASGMTLVIGQDYLSWKPRTSRLATLWKKGITVASFQASNEKGFRQ